MPFGIEEEIADEGDAGVRFKGEREGCPHWFCLRGAGRCGEVDVVGREGRVLLGRLVLKLGILAVLLLWLRGRFGGRGLLSWHDG